MANKYLLGLKRYLMCKVSVCTSKSSRLGSVYKLTMLTAQRSEGSNLRFQPILWSMTITRYYTIMQNRNKITVHLICWFNFVISPYAWLHVTCIHWEMSASWPGKTDNWQNVLCSYDPICAQIMAIKTWYYWKGKLLVGIIYIRESSYPFHWFISSVGNPLSSSHIRPFTLLFRLSLPNKDTPQLTLASGVKRSGWQAANEQWGCQICEGLIYISLWIYK